MRKTFLNTVGAMVVSAGMIVPAYGSGIPVFDGANFAEAIKDAIMQNKQLAEEVKQYAQLVQQYQQMVENAKALGNIKQLLALSDFGQMLINSQASKSIFQALYGLDPKSPIYEAQARNILEKKFNLPKSSTKNRAELAKYLGTSQDINKILEDWEASDRDTKEVITNMNNLEKEKRETEDILASADFLSAAAPTTPNSLNATAHHMMAQNELLMRQNEQRARLQKLQVELKIRDEMRRLEANRAAHERKILSLKRRQQFRQEAFKDINVWSSAQ